MAPVSRHLSISSTILLLAIGVLPIALFAPKALAVLAALGGLLTVGQLFGRMSYWRLFTLGSTLLIFGVVALAGASVLWSLNPAASAEAFKGVGTVAALGALLLAAAQLAPLDEPVPREVYRDLLGAILLGLALLLIGYLIVDYASDGGAHRLLRQLFAKFGPWHPNLAIRSVVALCLLFWTLLLVLDNAAAAGPAIWGRAVWLWRIVLVLGMAILIAMAPQIAARIAFVLGLGFYVIGRWGPPKLTFWLLLSVAVLMVLGLPFIIHEWLDPAGFGAQLKLQKYYSGQHRLFIWQFVAERIMERPWLGWGLDIGRIMPGGERVLSGGGEVLPMHPHNGFLQYWLELGLLGAAVLAGALIYVGHKLSRPGMTPAARAAGCGYTATVFTFAFLSFNSWHNWWIGMIVLTLAPLLLVARKANMPR